MPFYKFEDILEKEGELFFTNVGFSMYPLIKEREDILHIRKSDTYKRGDIILYKTNNGKYVLHRILKIKGNIIITAGDYNYFKDSPVSRDSVLGTLVSIKKKDGEIIYLDKDKRCRRFFYTNFFFIKSFIQRIMIVLHLRKIK